VWAGVRDGGPQQVAGGAVDGGEGAFLEVGAVRRGEPVEDDLGWVGCRLVYARVECGGQDTHGLSVVSPAWVTGGYRVNYRVARCGCWAATACAVSCTSTQ